MDVNSIVGSVSNLGFLNSLVSPDFIENLGSALPTFSWEHAPWIIGGLMLFRFFGGMLFSIIGLIGFILSTITAVFCSFISMIVKTVGSAAISLISLLGVSARLVFNSPIKFISIVLTHSGRFMIPVIASGAISSLFLYQNPFSAWDANHSEKKAWIALEEKVEAPLFEEF